MKFKTGDRVKFLNEAGGGTITEISSQKIVKVRIEEGFEIPVLVNDLIKADETTEYEQEVVPDRKRVKIIKPVSGVGDADPESFLPENIPDGALKNVLIGFIPLNPGNPGAGDVDVYLINDDDYGLLYYLGYQENVSWHYLKTGFLEPDTKINIATFDQSGISRIKTVHIQLIFASKGRYKVQSPVERFLTLDDVRFYKEKTYKANGYFHEKAMILKVTDDLDKTLGTVTDTEIAEALLDKETVSKEHPAVSGKNNETLEIDLHIEEISGNENQLLPGEILEIQMNKFHTALEKALTGKYRRIIFIHGVGNGKLKYEIIKALNEKYPDLIYQDASFREYGYGATMVYL